MNILLNDSFSEFAVENGAALNKGEMYASNESRFNPDFCNKELTAYLNGREKDMRAANDSRFTQAYFQQPLTQYAVGWTDEQNLDALLEFIAPSVQVPHRFEYREWLNVEAFVSDVNSGDDRREIGGEFKRVKYSSTKTTARTYNHGLTMRLDVEDVEETANWQQKYTAILLARMKRNHARRAWAATIAASTDNAFTWSTASGKDPDQDVITRAKAYKDAAGIVPNRALYTDGSWLKRLGAHRAQLSAGGFASSLFNTPEQLATYLRMPVLVSPEVYQSAASTKTLLAGSSDKVILFRADGTSMEDPSNFKNFWSPCPQSGQRYAVYVQPFGPKFWDITVEMYSYLATTSTVGVQSLTIS